MKKFMILICLFMVFFSSSLFAKENLTMADMFDQVAKDQEKYITEFNKMSNIPEIKHSKCEIMLEYNGGKFTNTAGATVFKLPGILGTGLAWYRYHFLVLFLCEPIIENAPRNVQDFRKKSVPKKIEFIKKYL